MNKNYVSAFLALFCAVNTFAAEFTVNGVSYATLSTTTVKVTDYTGVGTTLEIPASVTNGGTTYSVTAIGENACKQKNLVSIVLPNSIIEIEGGAFYENPIISFDIPESVRTIGPSAFKRCNSLESLVIPATVTSLGNSMLENCTGLKTLSIYASVSCFGDFTLSGTSVENIYVPQGTVPSYADKFGSHLNYIEIGRYFKVLDEGDKTAAMVAPFEDAPEGYSGDIVVPETVDIDGVTYKVTEIAQDAFRNNTNITSITLSKNVEVIGETALQNCSNLTTITLSEGLKTIGVGALMGTAISEIALPNSLTTILNQAFKKCSNLKTVVVPAGVKSLERLTFSECTSLEKAELLGVETMGDDTFYKCSMLNSVVFPASLTAIGRNTLALCPNLATVTCYADPAPTAYDRSTIFYNSSAGVIVYIPVGTTASYTSAWGEKNYVEMTSTAVEKINVNKPGRSVKTIENGKIVIIRGDKKYDVNGRKL